MRTIERCRDIDVLTQLVARRPAGAALKSVRRTRTGEHHLVLVPPATVALCALDARLAADPGADLRVLLVNAGQLDFLDGGQWYRFVAPMLDLKGRIEVTANVPDRSVLRHSMVREAVTGGMRIEVRQHEGSLESLLAGAGPEHFDLAVCFHGQTLWRSWHSEGVRQLVTAGVPVYVCEYGPLLAQLGMATSGLLGIQGEVAIERNRFALLSRVRGENWARTVWRCVEATADWTEIDGDGRTLATTCSTRTGVDWRNSRSLWGLGSLACDRRTGPIRPGSLCTRWMVWWYVQATAGCCSGTAGPSSCATSARSTRTGCH